MSIDRLPSGKWRVRVDVGRDKDGKRRRKSASFDTKREAQAQERAWLSGLESGTFVVDTKNFHDFTYEVYLPAVEKRVRYSTLINYQRDIKLRLIPAFGHMNLEDITREKNQRLIDECSSFKVAQNTRDTLRQILNFAVDRNFLSSNPAAARYTMPKREVFPDEHNGTWLTEFSQHDEFIAALDYETHKTIAVLGLSLGLRKGEIFGLDWEDIDFEKRLVHVSRTYVREGTGYTLMPPKTRESNRYIPMRKSCAEYLQRLRESREEKSGAIVINRYGKRASPDSMGMRYIAYVRKLGLPEVSLLNLRHSFATACLNAGMDISKVSRYLGHTSISTTAARYVRYKTEDLVADFDRYID